MSLTIQIIATDPSGNIEIWDGNNIRYTPLITVGYKLKPKVTQQSVQNSSSVESEAPYTITCIGSSGNQSTISDWPPSRGNDFSYSISTLLIGNPFVVDDYDSNEQVINGGWGSFYNGFQLISEYDRFTNPPSGPKISIALSGDTSVIMHGRIPEANSYEETIARLWSVIINNPSAEYIRVTGSINSTEISPVWVEPFNNSSQQIPLTVCNSCEIQFTARTLNSQYYSWFLGTLDIGR